MLIIRRRVGERIVVGSNVEVTVASATRRVVRLAIHAPKGIPVLRGEVHDAIVAANVAATLAIVEIPTDNDDADGDFEVELAVQVIVDEQSGAASTEVEPEKRQEKQDDSD